MASSAKNSSTLVGMVRLSSRCGRPGNCTGASSAACTAFASSNRRWINCRTLISNGSTAARRRISPKVASVWARQAGSRARGKSRLLAKSVIVSEPPLTLNRKSTRSAVGSGAGSAVGSGLRSASVLEGGEDGCGRTRLRRQASAPPTCGTAWGEAVAPPGGVCGPGGEMTAEGSTEASGDPSHRFDPLLQRAADGQLAQSCGRAQ